MGIIVNTVRKVDKIVNVYHQEKPFDFYVSKTYNVINECKNISEGILKGDYLNTIISQTWMSLCILTQFAQNSGIKIAINTKGGIIGNTG